MAEASPLATPLAPPLSAGELRRLARLGAPLPRAWTASVRRRRLMLLGLAAPGFAAIAATPAHQNFFVLVAGVLAFAAAFLFRSLTEPVFVRAEAAALWPPAADLPLPVARFRKDPPHA
jgi:hypothetical protein